MSGLLTARTDPPVTALAERLSAKARRLALAQAENRRLARAGDGRRWRDARLVWPLFAKD